jgi:hypothetical protein
MLVWCLTGDELSPDNFKYFEDFLDGALVCCHFGEEFEFRGSIMSLVKVGDLEKLSTEMLSFLGLSNSFILSTDYFG